MTLLLSLAGVAVVSPVHAITLCLAIQLIRSGS
jgi:hypothetical protein